jgi:hypothetical protein
MIFMLERHGGTVGTAQPWSYLLSVNPQLDYLRDAQKVAEGFSLSTWPTHTGVAFLSKLGAMSRELNFLQLLNDAQSLP